MAYSKVKICNMALVKVGGGRITALDEGVTEARVCNEIFDVCRDEVLSSGNWDFANKLFQLSQDDPGPSKGYQYSFAYPPDYLKTISVLGADALTVIKGEDFKSEGGKIITNLSDIWLKYIFREEDPTKYSANFVAALAARLGVDLASSVRKDGRLRRELGQEYLFILHQSLAEKTGNENPTVPKSSTGTYATSR